MSLLEARKKVVDEILVAEGGDKFTDDPSDSGGATRWGVTEKVARKAGYTGDMRDLPKEVAVEIYEKRYLDSVKFNELYQFSKAVAHEVVDTGVNCGVGFSSKSLQRCLNTLNNRGEYYPDITVDGDIGGQTLSAMQSFANKRGEQGMKVLYRMLNAIQGERYISLAEKREKDEKYIYGWFSNRVDFYHS